jgi:hypothetical protein
MMLTQAWLNRNGTRPDPARLRPCRGANSGTKPGGGLWTSTWAGRWRVRWVQWCLDEQFLDVPFDVWLLHPRPDAQVYAIDSYHDLEGLEAKFSSASASPRAPDWTAVADAYDGVHLSEG